MTFRFNYLEFVRNKKFGDQNIIIVQKINLEKLKTSKVVVLFSLKIISEVRRTLPGSIPAGPWPSY